MPPRPIFPVDLADPALFASGIPHAAFAELRRWPGLAWNAIGGDRNDGFWSVGRLADVAAANRDPATFSSALGHVHIHEIDEDALAPRASMIDMDPPEHTRLRQLISAHFTPRATQAHASAIARRVDAQLSLMQAQGGGDWVEIVAKPIPIAVIADILGVPEEDHDHLVELSEHLVASTSSRPPLEASAYGNTTELRLLPFANPAAHGFAKYARRLGAERRARPRDDLVSLLVHAQVNGERLTDAEFANFFRLLVVGGNETTRAAISHLALQFAAFPAAFEQVRRDGRLLAGAIEESVRHSSPVLYFRRTASRDAELAGTRIARGERLVLWYASANFDEAQFPSPLAFDVERPRRPAHVAYGGGGVHTCIGAPLARLELEILLAECLRRDLRWEIAGAPEFVDSNFVNGVERLNIRLV